MSESLPTAETAAAVVQHHLATAVQTVVRFQTGLAHYVYDVQTADGRHVVVRLGRLGQAADFVSAVSWHRLLVPRGVPLPNLLDSDVQPPVGSFPFMLMERLPGRDLNDEYPTLSSEQKRLLAQRLVQIQASVGELPAGPGFGFARSYEDPSLHATWADVLLASLERSRRHMQSAGVVSTTHVDRVARKLAAYHSYFAAIPPTAFLDDATTKNVLVHDGQLSGIVDVDWVCFGDPLFVVALTQMALLKSRYNTDYITFWTDELHLTADQHAVLSLYTAIFGVDFLGELGQRFNRDVAPAVDAQEMDYLIGTIDRLLSEV